MTRNSTNPIEIQNAELLDVHPVVVVMGQAGHGKTSIIDHISRTNGGPRVYRQPTQGVTAYGISLPYDKHITIVDTPSSESQVAQAANFADVILLVVAADAGVQAQTVEAIAHAERVGVPMVVAITNIDVAGADPVTTKKALFDHGARLEECGGTTLSADVSVATGANMDALLGLIVLQAEVLGIT